MSVLAFAASVWVLLLATQVVVRSQQRTLPCRQRRVTLGDHYDEARMSAVVTLVDGSPLVRELCRPPKDKTLCSRK